MICVISRNNPNNHPILKNIYNCIANTESRAISPYLRKKFGMTFYLSNVNYNSSKYIVVDDPLAFIYAVKILKISANKIIFYSLEMYEFQLENSSLKNKIRNYLFKKTHHYSLRKASKVIFPSKLRKDYYQKIRVKSDLIYNYPSETSFLIQEPSHKIISLLDKLKHSAQEIAVYAGSFQDGRNLSDFCKIAKNNPKIVFLLVGSYNEDDKQLNNIPANLYLLGRLQREEVNYIYSIVDIGILYYANTPLNTKYCAPVKLWEYSYYELRIIANDNFALQHEWESHIDSFLNEEYRITKTDKPKTTCNKKFYETEFNKYLQSIQ